MPKIEPRDVMQSTGDLAAVMFRNYSAEDFRQAVDVFLSKAELKVRALAADYDVAVGDRLQVLVLAETAWVYHQAYSRLAAIHANLPSSANEVNLSASYTNPAKENRILAGDWLDTFNALLPAPSAVAVLTRRKSSSIEMQSEF